MSWILIVVGIFNGEVLAQNEGVHASMQDCFAAREEYIWTTFGTTSGYPPVNFQVVCIPSDKY